MFSYRLATLLVVVAMMAFSPSSAEAQYRRSRPVEPAPSVEPPAVAPTSAATQQRRTPPPEPAALVEPPPARSVAAVLAEPASQFAPNLLDCHLLYNLKGWSMLVSTSKGEGEISCSDGSSALVTLKSYAGGFTVGKSEVIGGRGTFSAVRSIDELFGGYAKAEAHVGAGRSGRVAVVTKGEISLTLAGTGSGVNLGVAVGSFVITEKR